MSQFVEFLHEVFAEFGAIRSRRMFGGHGIYHDDLMFGLVADDQLFMKTDPTSLPEFVAAGCVPFEFDKDGKKMKMPYYLAPEEIYDDPERASYWANLSYSSALRSAAKQPSRRKKRN
ncbi:TfoX/Sxy family protein [Arenicella xantha]|uniref:DNA transformation protein n=1 Tax=Arenicella xantha TaxID=644221 RepID=A0A395JKL0_9GAMM|nr:TfoX/Sxy family protein [Arenicella xantha]RBP51302.1 DNA transformation protein [Arenicella xantha]